MDLRPGQHAGSGRAVLAGVEVPRDLDALHDRIEVGIVEHHHGRLAAELQVHALQGVGRRTRDLLAGRHVTGQGHHRHVGVAHESGAGGLAVPEDYVEDAVRKVLGADLGQPRGRQRRLLGRLQHDRVAGRERRTDLPDRHHQRVVPGRYLSHDADRLPPDHRRVALHVLTRSASLERARRAREEAQVVDEERHLLVPHRLDRLAHVERLELRELVGLLLEGVGDPQEGQRPLAGRCLGPLRESPAGGRHGCVHVALAGERRRRDLLPRRGIQDRLLGAVRCGSVLAVDEVLDLGLGSGGHWSSYRSFETDVRRRPRARRKPLPAG